MAKKQKKHEGSGPVATRHYRSALTGDVKVKVARYSTLLNEEDDDGNITVKGVLHVRDMDSEREAGIGVSPKRVGNLAYNSALTSIGAGIHPSQVSEFRELARQQGIVGVDWCPKTGDAMFESRKARRDYLKMQGFHDRDGGYGDG